MKRPIAMKCTQEQFDLIKDKFDQIDHFVSLDNYPYLCNNLNFKGQIGTNKKHENMSKDYEVHETWNEQIFLEACGIEAEPAFSITKEQIQTLEADGCTYVKEWFPEVFKKELIIGKWYKHNTNTCDWLMNYQGDSNFCYGFNTSSAWGNEYIMHPNENWTEATDQEVAEALKNEAVKRYSNTSEIDNSNICTLGGRYKISKNITYTYWNNGMFTIDEVYVFINGVWAKPIPTKQMTQAEIENELGYKIKIV